MEENYVYNAEKIGPHTIEHKGKKIFWFDLSNGSPEDAMEGSRRFTKILSAVPQNSALLLTDFTDMRFNQESVGHFKEFTVKNKPFIKKSAVLGIVGLKKIILQAGLKISGRANLKAFDDKEKAKEWLVIDE